VRVVQLGNVFPLGSCINCEVIKLPAFVNFFTTHFSWAVFENEPKWYWTQAQRGQLNYTDADRLLYFCDRAGKPVRGHCIFWAVEGEVQRWIKDIPATDRGQLTATVKARVRGLLGRYAGRFPHYDVNNEMLHGRFFRDRLGDAVAPLMFREAARLDPGAALFVNDYNVECGNNPRATPEKFVEQIRELQRGGARVGGIGLQGHVSSPVGEVICDALDKLSAATAHGPARLDHRARRPLARRGAPRRRPRGGAPGGVRAPGRGGDRVLGVHAVRQLGNFRYILISEINNTFITNISDPVRAKHVHVFKLNFK
jgi:hypothetical protein